MEKGKMPSGDSAEFVKVAKARVDWLDYSAPGASDESLSLHFNCWDENGDSLPGLGGVLDEGALAVLLTDSQAAEFKQLIIETAKRWIATYDFYASLPVKFTIVQVHRGDKGGRSMNVRFWREGDPIPSVLLLEYFPGYPVAHNRKRYYSDADIVAAVRADVNRIMDAADALALAANRQRKILKKERDG